MGFAIVVIYVNSRSVASFGTVEYWFAFIKVTAIVLFIILGTAQIFGLGAKPVGLHNLYQLPGGFFPHGFGGMWMAVIIGMLSFVGIEVIAVTSGETPKPEKAIPAALRTMAIRLFLFLFPGAGSGGGHHSLDADRRQRDGIRKPLRQGAGPDRHSATPPGS